MTQRDYTKMTTKKLEALLKTASDDQRAEIAKVLAEREQVKAPAAEATQAAPAEVTEAPAENSEASAAEAAPEAEQKKSKKMSDEQMHTLAEELRKTAVGHRCQVVPFNTIEWKDGTIVGVIEEKRSNKVLYAIKLDDGRRIVKVHDSDLVKIFDEMAETSVVTRTRTKKEELDKPWEPEEIEAALAEIAPNVGKLVKVGEETGRIMTIVIDRRGHSFMYRIEFKSTAEDGTESVKVMHKVYKASDITIIDELDEEGQKINEAYMKRRAAAAAKQPVTPESRLLACKTAFEKAQKTLEAAQKAIETKKAQLEEAQKEYDAWIESQKAEITGEAPAEATEGPESNEEPLA